METQNRGRAVFKSYTTNKIMLLPPPLEELISEKHPAHVVNKIVERIFINPLLKNQNITNYSIHPNPADNPADAEAVFGQIKGNFGCKRFILKEKIKSKSTLV
ncbi:MAG: hypothetical protein ACOCXH_08525 [Cyclobacteriaceae bacterium]